MYFKYPNFKYSLYRISPFSVHLCYTVFSVIFIIYIQYYLTHSIFLLPCICILFSLRQIHFMFKPTYIGLNNKPDSYSDDK